MPDLIGTISVPEIAASGVFPITPDRRFGISIEPQTAVHQFGSGNQKIEQRYKLGPNVRRFVIRKEKLSEANRVALRDFWTARAGAYQPFTFNLPKADDSGTDAVTVRFADTTLSWQQVANLITSVGVELVEQPTTSPSYTVSATLSRFPDAGTATALLQQAQEIIPLVRIQFKDSSYNSGNPIYLSDRRVTIGGQLYQARLLQFGGISQSLDGASDEGTFTFGNADGVMSALAAATDLWRAEIRFSLFKVDGSSGTKVDLWGGEITSFDGEESAEFTVYTSDGLDLERDHPRRKVDRSCQNDFNNGSSCPYASVGTPGFTSCDKAFASCQARGMTPYFTGMLVNPQGVVLKQKSFLSSQSITRTSQINESIMGQPLQEIYTDDDMPVNCAIASGREENEFYNALGIVGAGPITAYASDGTKHRLDGQPAHGPLPLGLRRSYGPTPAANNQPDNASNVFSLSPFTGPEKSAGTAFLDIRRTDPKGLQLSRIQDHQMVAWVAQGLGGYIWASGVRSWQAPLTNPVWIAVNTLFRSLDIQQANAATQEAIVDVAAAEAAAAICATTVSQIIGGGSETQFKFRGIVGADVKPVRDTIADILQNCLGYFTFANRKFKVGLRYNASVIEAFTTGNILLNSLKLNRFNTGANEITATFADEEFDYQTNTIRYEDELHRKTYGRRSASMNLNGCATKSRAARVVAVRTREECGGITLAEYRAARRINFKTTILALAVEPGMVCSMTHSAMPGGSGKFRVTRWRLNPDWSIDIEGRTVTDSMYDLTTGPKPSDVAASPVPDELVVDLVPGDVIPIGSDAFQITQSEITDSSEAKSIALDVVYNPPTTIGTFTGINGWLRRLSDGREFDLGMANYDGDGTGTTPGRYGAWRFVVPPPATVAETWEVYLTSWSPVVYKQLVLIGDPGTVTPNRTITVNPVTPGINPVAPTAVSLSVSPTTNTFALVIGWTPAVSPGGSSKYEREVRYFSDAACTTPVSDWIALGAVAASTTSTTSDYWPKPIADTWAKARVRALNSRDVQSSWVTTLTGQKIDALTSASVPVAAPVAPTAASLAVNLIDDTYSLTTTWTAGGGTGGNIYWDREVRFFTDAACTTPDSNWINLGSSPASQTSVSTDRWPRVGYDTWILLRVRGVNGNGAISSWFTTATGVKLDKSPYLSITNSATSLQVSGFSVSVPLSVRGGVPSGSYSYTFTAPATADYAYTRIERAQCNSSFVVVGAYSTVMESATSVTQPDSWPLPTNVEYWNFRAMAVSKAGIANTTAMPSVNVSISASGGVQAHLPSATGQVGTTQIANSAVTDPLISSVGPSKFLSGTATSTITLTDPVLDISTGSVRLQFDSVNALKMTNTAVTRFTQTTATAFRIEKTSDNLEFTQMVLGEVQVQGPTPSYYRASLSPTSLSLANQQVVTTRQASVTAPSGGFTVDSQARIAINDIISRLQTHGLIS